MEGISNVKKSQKSLKDWSKQDWGTKSGKKSSETGERYLPKKAREALSDSEYAATTAKKRKDKAAGKQHSKQPDKIADKTRKFRMAKGGKADGRLKRAGVSGYNKPKRTPNHPTKSHIVVAKVVKLKLLGLVNKELLQQVNLKQVNQLK